MLTKPDTHTPTAVLEERADTGPETLLEVQNLYVHFGPRGGLRSRTTGRRRGTIRAVDGINLTLRRGEVLGLVGESGSGKTTLGRTLSGLTAATCGSIRYRGKDIAGYSERKRRPLRRKLHMVVQDAHALLNPAMDIRTAVGHPLRIHHLVGSEAEYEAKVADALERVGLTPTERFLRACPADLSDDQKLRAVLAREIIAEPELLVVDELISRLDMSLRPQIAELLLDLKRQVNLTYVHLTRDLAGAKSFCDHIAIMYLGRIVEYGPTEQVFSAPRHPYTKALLAAIHEPDPNRSTSRELWRGELPDAARPPLGCSFHPRCLAALAGCGWEGRDLRALLDRRLLELPIEQHAREKALIAHLRELTEPEPGTVTIAPGKGHSAQDVLEYLRGLREEASAANPREPFWSGVVTMRVENGGVVLQFEPPQEPRLQTLSGSEVQVACHLYFRSSAVDS